MQDFELCDTWKELLSDNDSRVYFLRYAIYGIVDKLDLEQLEATELFLKSLLYD